MIESVNRSLTPELNTPSTANANSSATANNDNAFRGTLWEAFTGHAGPVTNTTAVAPAPPPTSPSATSGSPSTDVNLTGDRNTSPTPAPATTPTLTRTAPVTTAPYSSTSSTSGTVKRTDAANTTDPVQAVSTAMTRLGLDPSKYNLRVGSMPITIPSGGSYEYPVLWADVGTETLGFWLPSALSSPGMIAANIGNMIGTPIYEII